MASKKKIPLKISRKINSLIDDLKRWKEVQAIYLFGSYAKGKQTPFSDLDLAVMIQENKNLKKIETEVGLSSSPDTDVVPFHRLPLYIQFEVFKFGKLLFVKNKKSLIELKIKVLDEYLDQSSLYEKMRARLR